MKRTARVVVFAGMIALVGGGVAYASIPDSDDGEIHGCISNGSFKALSVIDKEAGANCPGGWTELVWNQRGPTGATGPQGPAGSNATVPPGTLYGAHTTTYDGTVPASGGPEYKQFDCPTGEALLDAAGFRQRDSHAVALQVLNLTGGDPGPATAAIFDWQPGITSDQGYQVFITCAHKS